MSRTFGEALKNTLDNQVSITENGMVGYATSGKKLLDLNFAVSSLRGKSDEDIIKMFSEAYYENPKYAVKWLFFARDIRGGMGERNLFRVCLKWLSQTKPEIVNAVIPVCAEYGRFDDLWCLLDTSCKQTVVDLIQKQLTSDMEAKKAGKSVSLLTKWMPSCNTSSPATRKLAKILISELGMTEKFYRKTLSELRKYLDVTEVKTSAKEWSAIDYQTVPSMANLKYKNAFLRNDETRRRAYLASLEKGEAKINAAASTPVDIAHNYTQRHDNLKDETLEAMWKTIVAENAGKLENTLCVVDGSGSMSTSIGSGSLTAHDVANGLGLYFADISTGFYKDHIMTFGGSPRLVDLSRCMSLKSKLEHLKNNNDCMNTNIALLFRVLLKSAVDNKVPQSEMPKNLLIISDMEMDSEGGGCYIDLDAGAVDANDYSYWYQQRSKTIKSYDADTLAMFNKLRKEYEDAGYAFPRLVFWNTNNRSNTIPLKTNPAGVALVSGFSQSILKMVVSNKLDPYEVLLESINDKRYDLIENAIKDLL